MSRDIPIIFSAPMVRALLDGRKTMTRRLAWREEPGFATPFAGDTPRPMPGLASPWQRINPGDRLWVRETITCSGALAQYKADHKTSNIIWGADWKQSSRPSIHMPRRYSRLTLVITDVKIERLNNLSEDDAVAEGIAKNPVQANDSWMAYPEGSSAAGWLDPRESFRSLWTWLHGDEAWTANPDVVAFSFTVHKQNIDALPSVGAL